MKLRVMLMVAMLALSGVAHATNQCGDRGGCNTGGGDGGNATSTANGGAGGAGGDASAGAVGVGIGVGIAGASSESKSSADATAGALAGAAVVDSGNSVAGAAVLGSGNSDVKNTNNNTAVGGTGGKAEVDNTNLNVNTAEGGKGGTAFASGGDARQGQLQGQQQGQVAVTGDSNSRANAVTGPSISGAITGDSTATSTTGDQTTSVATGDVSNSASVAEGAVQSDVSTEVNVDASTKNDYPVSSAAPSFSSICSSGAAGQGSSWGMSIAVTSDVCMMLQMADAYMALGDKAKAIEYVEKAGAHAKVKGFMGYLRHIVTIGIM